jgi:DNA-binding CsgD family transcriptional regulator
VLHGRDVERARLAALLADARAGHATTLLVRGGAGVGKSALLDDTASQAEGADAPFRVLRTVGLRAESAFPFAGLHRLLRPILASTALLPAPQAQALGAAFGEREGDRLDPFLVGLATLGLLTEAAETAPVLGVVDDLQWLDPASAEALLFAARRLLAERAAILFAARDDDPDFVAPTDVPALHLEGLDGAAVRSLLLERTGRELPGHVVADLTAQTEGNPLAVVELPTGFSAALLEGRPALPHGVPLAAHVERVFLERCRTLTPDGQTLMLLAAADDAVPLPVLRAAAADRAVGDRAFAEVETAGLLGVGAGGPGDPDGSGEMVRVRHPLVRSAVYQAATTMERREAHAALARAVGSIDPDRYAWHLSAAVDGPDETVAGLLDALGARSQRRRGHLAASSAYERAARLSTHDAERAHRLLHAARNAYAAGRLERASALLDAARPIADDPLLRADIDRLRGRIHVVAGSAVDAHRIFVTATRDVADLDSGRALEMAAAAGVLHSHGVGSGSVLPPGTLSTDVAPEDAPRLHCLKLLLRSTELDAAEDWGTALPTVRSARAVGMVSEDRDVWANLANMALHLGDDDLHRSLFTAMTASARAEGAVMEVLYARNRLGLSEFVQGDWTGVRSGAEESISLARSIGQTSQTAIPLTMLALLAAHQGRPEYDDLLAHAMETSSNHRLGVMDRPVRDLLRWARAVFALHAGDAAEAFHHLDQMHVPALTRLAATARLTGAVRAGERSRATRWTERLELFAEATGASWAHAAGHLGRALLADHEDASTHFEAALSHHEAARRPYDAACTQLAYGEHLRRAGRRVEARTHLKKAHQTFRDLDAGPLAERASNELRASGESARKRDPSTFSQLTPTELQMARLVSQGLTNKEVAEQCWVSPRTVAFHLRNVFTKTGITSRTQLAQLDLG